MFLKNLTNAHAERLFANQHGVLVDQRNQPLYISAKGKAISFRRLDICLLTLVRRALGLPDPSRVERAIAKSYKELKAMVSRFQAQRRYLNGHERSELRAMKITFETVSRVASDVWSQRTVKPRTPDWIQYTMGTRQAVEGLLIHPRFIWQVLDRNVLPTVAEQQYKDLCAEVRRYQALGRPLVGAEKRELREKQESFEALCGQLREEWNRQGPRVTEWMQYEVSGMRNAVEQLLRVI